MSYMHRNHHSRYRRPAIGACGLLLFAAPMAAADPARVGEPYAMAGKRLVFSTWIHVRPGDVGWRDAAGDVVNADEKAKLGPFDSVWSPTDHMPWGIRIRAHQPAEVRPWAIEPQHPWEKGSDIYIQSILRENGIYKAWGNCRAGSCYLESKDAMVWTRPELGLVEFDGNKANNLIPSRPDGDVFIDPTSTDERYKCLWVEENRLTGEQLEDLKKRRPDRWGPRVQRTVDGKPFVICVFGAVSRDGFAWKRLPDPVLLEHCDTRNIGYYDPRRKKYVAYVRTWNALERASSLPAKENYWDYWLANGRRSIGRSESDDFRNFPRSKLILEPGPELSPSDGLYTNCFTWIPGAPDHLVMFPAIRHIRDDTTTIAFAASANGVNWHWVPGSPLIPTGPFGRWDGGCVFAAPPLIERGDGSFALRVRGDNFPHKYPRGLRKIEIGLAVWPHGRLVALEAPERGAFATVAVIPKGTKLYLNARTKRTGHIRVAAQIGTRGAKIIPGREFDNAVPIIGDQPRVRVRWQNADDLGIKPGEPVILLFQMEQAEIFALEFE